jgi:hypothetical protein
VYYFWQKIQLGYILGDFFHDLIWSPCQHFLHLSDSGKADGSH